jgi:hypothetical protein
MATIDPYQVLTLIFGALIILTVIVEYNSTTLEQHLQQFLDMIAGGLGFLFAVYALTAARADNSKASGMYRNFVYLVAILAIVLVCWTGTSANWSNVQNNVAVPLAEGSLFALPIAFFFWGK